MSHSHISLWRRTCRKKEIIDAVQSCLQSREATCTIDPIPQGDSSEPPALLEQLPTELLKDSPPKGAPSPLQGKACKDATAALPLRRLLSIQRTHSEPGKSGFLMTSQPDNPLGRPEDLEASAVLPFQQC